MKADKQNPLITIGMTCYNAEDTILRALDGALTQDWPHFEIVIVDDGSVDQSVAILQKKIQNHKNITLIVHEKNKGFPAALNTMIAHAKGEFIAIFDDDDQSRSDRISCQYRTIVDYESKTAAPLVACYASGIRLYPNGYQMHFQAIGSRPKIPVGLCVADHLLFFQHMPGVFFGGGTPSCSLMTRKTTYAAIGPYDETLRRSEDTDFSVRLARKDGHFIGCAEEVIYQYSTDGADKRPLITYQGYRALIEKHHDYLVSRRRYDYALAWQKFKYHHFARQPLRALGTLLLLAARHPVWTLSQFWRSVPKRFIHEWRIRRKSPAPRGQERKQHAGS